MTKPYTPDNLGFTSINLTDDEEGYKFGTINRYDGTLHLGKFTDETECLYGFYRLTDQPTGVAKGCRNDETFTPWRNQLEVFQPWRFHTGQVMKNSVMYVLVIIGELEWESRNADQVAFCSYDMDPIAMARSLLAQLNSVGGTSLLLQQNDDREELAKIPVSIASRVVTPSGIQKDVHLRVESEADDCAHIVSAPWAFFLPVIELRDYRPSVQSTGEKIGPSKEVCRVKLHGYMGYPSELKALPCVSALQPMLPQTERRRKRAKRFDDRQREYVWLAPYIDPAKHMTVADRLVSSSTLKIDPEWFGMERGYRIPAERADKNMRNEDDTVTSSSDWAESDESDDEDEEE